jgi:hypothetical protein
MLALQPDATAVVLRCSASLRRSENFVSAMAQKYVASYTTWANGEGLVAGHDAQIQGEQLARFLLVDSNWARLMFGLVDSSSDPIQLNNRFKSLFPSTM